eukprot:1378709-Rhodomonas_salina.2
MATGASPSGVVVGSFCSAQGIYLSRAYRAPDAICLWVLVLPARVIPVLLRAGYMSMMLFSADRDQVLGVHS